MKHPFIFAAAACAAALATPALIGSALADPLPLDQPITVDGITTVCTGIGEDAQNDPRWKAYPVRVEFSNDKAQYLAGAHVELSEGGRTLASVDCSGAWLLFQLPAGNYQVHATLLYHRGDSKPRSASFSPPASGQKRVVLQFKGVSANE